jgi:uncharacterized alkaline shock family protein YloU
MAEQVPDGPADPRFSVAPGDERTTIIHPPGYGGHPAAPMPPSAPAPRVPPAPPGPAGLPTEPAGRIYGTGELHPAADHDPADDPDPGPGRAADRGRTTIADEVAERVIERIVTDAADQVEGVRAVRPTTGPDGDRPVSVQLDGGRAVIDVAVEVEFGHPLYEVVDGVRDRVIDESERLLGLTTVEVNVLVAAVSFESPPEPRSPL